MMADLVVSYARKPMVLEEDLHDSDICSTASSVFGDDAHDTARSELTSHVSESTSHIACTKGRSCQFVSTLGLAALFGLVARATLPGECMLLNVSVTASLLGGILSILHGFYGSEPPEQGHEDCNLSDPYAQDFWGSAQTDSEPVKSPLADVQPTHDSISDLELAFIEWQKECVMDELASKYVRTPMALDDSIDFFCHADTPEFVSQTARESTECEQKGADAHVCFLAMLGIALGLVVRLALQHFHAFHLSTGQATIAACVLGGLISHAASRAVACCSRHGCTRADDPYEKEFWESFGVESRDPNEEFESVLLGMMQETETLAPFHQHVMGDQDEICLADLSDKYVRTPMVLLEELDFESDSAPAPSPEEEEGAAAASNRRQNSTCRVMAALASVALFGRALRVLALEGHELQDAFCQVVLAAFTMGGVLRFICGSEPQVAGESPNSSNHICQKQDYVYHEGFWHDECECAEESKPTSALAEFLNRSLQDHLVETDMAECLCGWAGNYFQSPMVLEAEEEWDS